MEGVTSDTKISVDESLSKFMDLPPNGKSTLQPLSSSASSVTLVEGSDASETNIEIAVPRTTKLTSKEDEAAGAPTSNANGVSTDPKHTGTAGKESTSSSTKQ